MRKAKNIAKDPLKARKQKRAEKKHKKKHSIFLDRRNRWLLVGVVVFILAGVGLWAYVELRTEPVTEVQRESQQFNTADQLYEQGQFAKAAEEFEHLAQEQTGEQRAHNLTRAGQAWVKAEKYEKAITAFEAALTINGLPAMERLEISDLATNAADQAGQLDKLITFLENQREILASLPEGHGIEDATSLRESIDKHIEAVKAAQEHQVVSRFVELRQQYNEVSAEGVEEAVSAEQFTAMKQALTKLVSFSEENSLPDYLQSEVDEYRNALQAIETAEQEAGE